jgi:hypothetical protein
MINWVAQVDRDAGVCRDALTTAEPQAITCLRRENRHLEMDISPRPLPRSDLELSVAAGYFGSERKVLHRSFDLNE